MKKMWVLLLLTASASHLIAGGDHKGLNAAVDGFYKALNQLFTGDMTAMEAVWSHRDDITYLSPTGGIKKGWKAVSADWEAQAALQLNGRVEPQNLHITQNGSLAVVVNYEVGEVKGPDGKVAKVNIRATSTFRLENGVWKMIGHHADPLDL